MKQAADEFVYLFVNELGLFLGTMSNQPKQFDFNKTSNAHIPATSSYTNLFSFSNPISKMWQCDRCTRYNCGMRTDCATCGENKIGPRSNEPSETSPDKNNNANNAKLRKKT